ncbi:unnamed protein product [Trichogramma brassicae]|uniref:Uncharacterized protein n=1 Tax=Trichogramma brassicae TaxID=86971 RepID=A0A6H5JAT1_9HYME|nr:unnamed protein product [Trichogramma brassicae]
MANHRRRTAVSAEPVTAAACMPPHTNESRVGRRGRRRRDPRADLLLYCCCYDSRVSVCVYSVYMYVIYLCCREVRCRRRPTTPCRRRLDAATDDVVIVVVVVVVVIVVVVVEGDPRLRYDAMSVSDDVGTGTAQAGARMGPRPYNTSAHGTKEFLAV